MRLLHLAAQPVHVRLLRLVLAWALLVMSYMMVGLPWRGVSGMTPAELVSFAALLVLFGGTVFSLVAIRRAPTATGYLLVGMACYGVVMSINFARVVPSLLAGDWRGPVGLSYALAGSLGVALILAALLARPIRKPLPPAA